MLVMRALLVIVPLLLLVLVPSCGHKAVGGYHPVRSADGTTWYSIECGQAFDRCLATAVSLCPQGYDTSPVHHSEDDGDVKVFSMMARCRATASVAGAVAPSQPATVPAPPTAAPPTLAEPAPAPSTPSRFRPYDK